MNFYNQKRLMQLLVLLYQEETLSEKELMSRLHVSDRTIRSDVKNLNEELLNYGAKIIRIRKKGYFLEQKATIKPIIQTLEKGKNIADNAEYRLKRILLQFFITKKYVTFDELMNTLYVSRATLSNYVKKIRKMLQAYSLKLMIKSNVGYYLSGSERDKRNLLYNELLDRNFQDYLSGSTTIEQVLFETIAMNELSSILDKYSNRSELRLSDYGRKNLSVLIAISLKRNQEQQLVKQMTMNTDQINEQSEVYHQMDEILLEVNREIKNQLTLDDIEWIKAEFFSENNLFQMKTGNYQKTDELVNDFLVFIDYTFNEQFQKDGLLRKELIQHLNTFLPLIKNNQTIKNPMLEIIKSKYSYAYELALQGINESQILSAYQFKESDVGFIALHIAAALERKYSHKELITVLIVNGLGKSLGTLIEASIKRKFAQKVKIVAIVSLVEYQLNCWEAIDLIVSTVPIRDKKNVVIEMKLTSIGQDLDKVNVFIDHYATSSKIKRLFSEDLFYFNEKKVEREELLNQLIEMIPNLRKNTQTFKENVMARENMAPTNITDFIAIPHSITETIDETKVVIAVSKQDIRWSNNKGVRLVFLIAVNDKDIDKLQLFFELLSELVEDEERQKRLVESTNYAEFISHLVNG